VSLNLAHPVYYTGTRSAVRAIHVQRTPVKIGYLKAINVLATKSRWRNPLFDSLYLLTMVSDIYPRVIYNTDAATVSMVTDQWLGWRWSDFGEMEKCITSM